MEGEEAFLVIWPRRLSALNPPLKRRLNVDEAELIRTRKVPFFKSRKCDSKFPKFSSV